MMSARLWNLLIGIRPTRAEIRLDFAAVIISLILMIGIAIRVEVNWNVIQWIGALFLAADLVGGAVVNATDAAKRQYHGPTSRPRDHLLFNAGHAIHLGLLALLFGVDSALGLLPVLVDLYRDHRLESASITATDRLFTLGDRGYASTNAPVFPDRFCVDHPGVISQIVDRSCTQWGNGG